MAGIDFHLPIASKTNPLFVFSNWLINFFCIIYIFIELWNFWIAFFTFWSDPIDTILLIL